MPQYLICHELYFNTPNSERTSERTTILNLDKKPTRKNDGLKEVERRLEKEFIDDHRNSPNLLTVDCTVKRVVEIISEKRVFVPLTTECYKDFNDNGKCFEVRRAEKNFSRKHVLAGKKMTISPGFGGEKRGESSDGYIGKIVFGSLEDILRKLPLKKVEPRAKTRKEAEMENYELLGPAEEYVAFEFIEA